MLATPLAAAYSSYAATAAPMKITRVETVYWKSPEDAPFRPNWTWLKIDTDAGISGIGETYPRNAVEAAMVHTIAPSLIGRDPGISNEFGPTCIAHSISRSPGARRCAC